MGERFADDIRNVTSLTEGTLYLIPIGCQALSLQQRPRHSVTSDRGLSQPPYRTG